MTTLIKFDTKLTCLSILSLKIKNAQSFALSRTQASPYELSKFRMNIKQWGQSDKVQNVFVFKRVRRIRKNDY
jgi:hypothetical protein